MISRAHLPLPAVNLISLEKEINKKPFDMFHVAVDINLRLSTRS